MPAQQKQYSPADRGELVLTRLLDAPRELVFEAWTDEKQFAQWWGPDCFTNPVCKLDVRPGGHIRDDMTAPDGTVYPMGGMFLTIVPPSLLVFTTTAFEDESGHALLENHNTVTFEAEGNKTRLTVRVVVLKAAPQVEGALSGMEAGWTQSLERLHILVKRL